MRAPPREIIRPIRNFEPAMDILLTPEQRQIRDMVRDFAESEIRPGVVAREKGGEFPHEVVRRMGELGLLGMMIPEEYGGSGLDALSYALAVEEVARVCASSAVIMSVTNSVCCFPIWKFGTEEQKNEILRPLAAGEAIGGYALTEPQSGSDAGNQKTRAVRDGDSWVLNGAKAWITNAGPGRTFVVMAATSPEKGRKGISAFLVDADTPGFRVGAPEDKMGLRASKTAAIFLEECRVPASRMLGREGDGFRIAMTTLDHSRVGIAAQAVGVGQAALEESIAYSKSRESFGVPIGHHQAIAFALADMATKLEAARLLTWRAAVASEGPAGSFSVPSSMAKLFASETANEIVARGVQIHGGYGYSREYPIERLFRDARVLTIYEGTSEIQRMVIGRGILAG
jgi:alkylation response protein AidB-like acyl-CoA dehydrogenase